MKADHLAHARRLLAAARRAGATVLRCGARGIMIYGIDPASRLARALAAYGQAVRVALDAEDARRMAAAELLTRARAAGMRLELEAGGGVAYEADEEPPPELLAGLRAYKAEIAGLLAAERDRNRAARKAPPAPKAPPPPPATGPAPDLLDQLAAALQWIRDAAAHADHALATALEAEIAATAAAETAAARAAAAWRADPRAWPPHPARAQAAAAARAREQAAAALGHAAAAVRHVYCRYEELEAAARRLRDVRSRRAKLAERAEAERLAVEVLATATAPPPAGAVRPTRGRGDRTC